MNRNINPNCFSVALAPLYHSHISQLNLVLFEQCDQMIPELCANFSFISNLTINLNNFALNFDNLPQSQTVSSVTHLTVRKNKYLFQPLVTMASNMKHLRIYFKEFTPEE